MFTITKPAPDRVDITISGALDAAAMESGLSDLLEKSKGLTNGCMLYTITELAMPTLGALSVEMQHLPKLFGLLGRFDRCAVVSDAAWIRTAAEVEGALFPGIEIKAFPENAREAAQNWLCQTAA